MMSMSKDEDTPIQPSVVQNNLDPVVCGILAERNWKYQPKATTLLMFDSSCLAVWLFHGLNEGQ